jgi:hypothetical protein
MQDIAKIGTFFCTYKMRSSVSWSSLSLTYLSSSRAHLSTNHRYPYGNKLTVVKELRSKMFGQHRGYFKAIFLKQTITQNFNRNL